MPRYNCCPSNVHVPTCTSILELSALTFHTFAAVDCGTLNHPVDGSVMIAAGTTFGSTVEYRCNTGFFLSGNIMRTCQLNAQWSGSQPTCVSTGRFE